MNNQLSSYLLNHASGGGNKAARLLIVGLSFLLVLTRVPNVQAQALLTLTVSSTVPQIPAAPKGPRPSAIAGDIGMVVGPGAVSWGCTMGAQAMTIDFGVPIASIPLNLISYASGGFWQGSPTATYSGSVLTITWNNSFCPVIGDMLFISGVELNIAGAAGLEGIRATLASTRAFVPDAGPPQFIFNPAVVQVLAFKK